MRKFKVTKQCIAEGKPRRVGDYIYVTEYAAKHLIERNLDALEVVSKMTWWEQDPKGNDPLVLFNYWRWKEAVEAYERDKKQPKNHD